MKDTSHKPPYSERINLRCSPEQKKFLLEAAASAGLTLSAYLLGDKLGSLVVDSKKEKK